MEICRVKAVLHSGSKGERGKPRREVGYALLPGTLVLFDMKETIKDKPALMYVLNEELGNAEEVRKTSDVVSKKYILHKGETIYEIETMNSIYVLRKE